MNQSVKCQYVFWKKLHMKNSARCRVNDSIEIEKQEAEGIRMIPYQSVGREHGMMPAVMANDMKITKEDRIIEHKKAVIAISKVSLSKWGAYEMLLHPDLIKNGR